MSGRVAFKRFARYRPYQSVQALRDFRDSISHGKLLRCQYTAEDVGDGSHFLWNLSWFDQIEDATFERSITDIRDFSQALLLEVRKKSDHPQLMFDAYEGPFRKRDERLTRRSIEIIGQGSCYRHIVGPRLFYRTRLFGHAQRDAAEKSKLAKSDKQSRPFGFCAIAGERQTGEDALRRTQETIVYGRPRRTLFAQPDSRAEGHHVQPAWVERRMRAKPWLFPLR